jgi:predicted acylesterase/phospholipase RssA
MFRRTGRSNTVVGLALSGGGSRGACQAGVLKALNEASILPQVVTGTSAGAVNAVWYALYPQRLDVLESIWLALRTQDVFPGNKLRLLMNFSRRGYIHAPDMWERFLRKHLGSATFEDMPVSCAVVAVRLSDGRRALFDSGEVVPAIMASTAIPGVFPPYAVGSELYVDGGVLEYLPVPTAIEKGATEVYAVDCSWYVQTSTTKGSVVDRCARISAHAAANEVTSLPAVRGCRVHLLRPELPEFDDGRDFRYTADLIGAGYAAAVEYLGSPARPEKAGGKNTAV